MKNPHHPTVEQLQRDLQLTRLQGIYDPSKGKDLVLITLTDVCRRLHNIRSHPRLDGAPLPAALLVRLHDGGGAGYSHAPRGLLAQGIHARRPREANSLGKQRRKIDSVTTAGSIATA